MAGSRGNPNVCHAFQATGRCKFGDRCRYSHTSSPGPANHRQQQSTRGSPRAQRQPPARREGKFHEWKKLLSQQGQSGHPSYGTASKFFGLGLELMEGDVGAAQEAIRELITEAGLGLVKDVMDRHIPQATSDKMKFDLWSTQLEPLFRLATHPRVVDSAVLEQEVATLYNFFLGVGGRRMSTVFAFIASLIASWPTSNPEPASNSGSSRSAAVELSLATLSKIIDCNTTNIVNEAFSPIVDQLAAYAEPASRTSELGEEFSQLQASKYVHYIRRRLGTSLDLLPVQDGAPSQPVFRESFVLRRDFPGTLSADGPRHDNDHASITEIRIMPTSDEIRSPREEYLPTNDPSQWHVQGIQGRLDREFRLLREDTVGQFRDAVRDMLEHIREKQKLNQQPRQKRQERRSQNSARTNSYGNAAAFRLQFDDQGGLEVMVACRQPPALVNTTLNRRREWWTQTKRLQDGALVCVLDVRGSLIFFVVSENTMRTGEDGREKLKSKTKWKQLENEDTSQRTEKLSLADDGNYLYVCLRLVEPNHYSTSQLLRWYSNVDSAPQRFLVEFPGVLLASFQYTLEALKKMQQTPNLPFIDLIAPTKNTEVDSDLRVKPPQFARKVGFTYNLTSITTDGKPFFVSPTNLSSTDLAERSALDPTQARAVIDTLSRELALIQGPPGTGKSHTGEKIIRALVGSNLGPILCVCYTNHALDQLLEHLLDGADPDGRINLIRMGSRSKSERLENLNLRVVTKDMTRAERQSLYELHREIRDLVERATKLVDDLAQFDSLKSLQLFLSNHYPRHHMELFGQKTDKEGFEIVGKKRAAALKTWLNGGEPRSQGQQQRTISTLGGAVLSTMNRAERESLHRYWLKGIREPIITNLTACQGDFAKAKERRDRVRQDIDQRCLQQADVVGITTTGLARNLGLLRKLRCKVVLCEEAGEVLEAHLLTALLPSVEQAILIGDHLQLRPQIQNYELQSTNPRGARYSLDTSLFERLVNPPHDDDVRLPFSTLETQRRMHPSIAELVRATLYPMLNDAENVTAYPDVVGMARRLFWFHHERLEAGTESQDPSGTSHTNDFEVEMTIALVSHLVRQGVYGPGDIAVITPYLGQLHQLRRRMAGMFEICLNDRDREDLEAQELLGGSDETPAPPKIDVGRTTLLKSVRAATVDNFQGEEAKVVVISLVRSNPQNKCGFLNTSNRINVLLSRAKHGMYIIGNANTYCHVPMWANVLDILQRPDAGCDDSDTEDDSEAEDDSETEAKNITSNFGPAFPLQCPRHPDTPILVSEPDDFVRFAPESGCQRRCDRRLDCGHACIGRCHAEPLHQAVQCLEKCQRIKKGCDHPCPLPCGKPCHKKCQTRLVGLRLSLPQCGHVLDSALCWEAQDPQVIRCRVLVERELPGCGHKVRVPCCEDVADGNYQCPAECGHVRHCGHACKSKCTECRTKKDGRIMENHGICKRPCGRNYTACQHTCQKACHGNGLCPPCDAPCEVRCSHSRCNKRCHEPCAPCAAESCASACQHSQCTMPCAAPCDWVPCSKRCESILDCGHQCPSLCGEKCPGVKYCQTCGGDAIKSAVVDFIEMAEYRDINLDEDPCIFPDCGHFFTRTSMDGQMDMAAHYDMDDTTGVPRAVKTSSQPFSMDEVKVCSGCRGSLRNIARYGRIVRRALLDEATKKFITWSHGQYLNLAERLLKEQENLENNTTRYSGAEAGSSRSDDVVFADPHRKLLDTIAKHVGNGRYTGIIRHWSRISAFASDVLTGEQPFQRVADFVTYAKRQRLTTGHFDFEDSVIQVRGHLLTNLLLLKCELIVLSDFVRLRQKKKDADTELSKLDFSAQLDRCEELMALARERVFPEQEVECHLYYARFCGISRTLSPAVTPSDPPASITAEQPAAPDKRLALAKQGFAHIAQARAVMQQYPSTKSLEPELDAAESALRDGVFYEAVSTAEKRAVYAAMAAEFRGTGHWYTCAQGHPFTVGECGMPMELARCPQCNAAVGGLDHRPALGVRRAEDIEFLGAGVAGMRL